MFQYKQSPKVIISKARKFYSKLSITLMTSRKLAKFNCCPDPYLP
jgi:hypothetical protein